MKPTGRLSLLAAGLALLAGGCEGSPADGTTSRQKTDPPPGAERSRASLVDVRVRVIEPQMFRETLEVTGTLRAWKEVDVSAELGGLIREIAFEKGDPVDAGQVLARVGDDIARAQLEQARAELVDAEEKQRRAEQLFEREAIPEQDLIAATARRDAQRALVEERQLRLERSVVRAPISGTAVDEPVDEGEVIVPGTRLTTIQQIERLKLHAEVPDTEVGWLEVGRPASLTVDAYPDREFAARVHFVSPSADSQTRTFPIELALDNPELRLKPGMIARVALVRRVVEEAIVIPIDAVLTHEDGEHAFVVEEGRAKERTIEIEGIEGESAMVRSGLSSGDHLVVSGQRQVAPGQRVRAREVP